MFRLIESESMKKLERALDASALRQNVLSQNLANVNTPYYKRLDIDFKTVFAAEVDKNELQLYRTHPKHIPSATPVEGAINVTRETKTLERYDQNNIDPEYEMAQVAENSLFFQAVSQKLAGKFSTLKMVIRGQ